MPNRLKEYFFPSPLRDLTALQRFLSSQASYLAQRTSLEFCRNTLGYFNQHYWRDDRFLEELAVCRWESFAALAEDMAVLLEGHLRPHARPAPGRLVPPLTRLVGDILDGYEKPRHRPDGWADVVERSGLRLAQAQLAAPKGPMDISKVSAQRFYDTMPVRSNNKAYDMQVIENAVRFGFAGFAGKLGALLRPEPVAAALLAAPPGA
jgi:hypothetical protein